MNRFSLRENAPSILVATVSAAFGVSLLQTTGNLAVMVSQNEQTGSSGLVAVILQMLALVFIAIAIYVGAIVTANTFATIIAGRTRTIALMRLIGSTARAQRRAVASHGAMVGVIGALAGALLGTFVSWAMVTIAVASRLIPALDYGYLSPVLALPVLGVVLTTWLASWVGSRRVLEVTPIQATGAAVSVSQAESAGRRGRNVAAITLFVLGTLLLLAAVGLGLLTPLALLVGVVGGMLSFSGLVLGAQLVMPRALAVVGRMFGSTASGALAAQNALRYPERSTRMTVGLVIAVTLVTMFAVAAATFQRAFQAVQDSEVEALVTAIVTIFSTLIGFSALLAAIGLVNNLSLSVVQRTRELGLLRALGFTSGQLRGMIRAESAQLTIAAVLVGMVMGIFYGWVGAQSMLGSVPGAGGLTFPTVPLWLIVVVVVSSALLTLIASLAPARRATRVAPVRALAVE